MKAFSKYGNTTYLILSPLQAKHLKHNALRSIPWSNISIYPQLSSILKH